MKPTEPHRVVRPHGAACPELSPPNAIDYLAGNAERCQHVCARQVRPLGCVPREYKNRGSNAAGIH
ncbi:MAG: hypothetical protein QGI93_05765, partial [Planctomycetota bacterium]|nr:hypothetical protein [Planctomycetota bacterium]